MTTTTQAELAPGITFPGETREYRAARDELLRREIELRRATEAVAQARRELPPGGPIGTDYVFERPGVGGTASEVRMSQLFAPQKDTLLVYSFMFGPERETPCPGCTALLQELESSAALIRQRVGFVVVAASPLERILGFAERMGWRNLAFLSTAGNSYNRDYHAQTPDGFDLPMLNVFQRTGGEIRHFWGSELVYQKTEPGQDGRALNQIEPLWNMLDFTPAGRGSDWYPDVGL